MTEKPRELRISHRPRGEKKVSDRTHANQRFTDEEAAAFIERWHRNASVSVMAREAGVSRRTMQDLCTGLSYQHLHEARRLRLEQEAEARKAKKAQKP